MKRSPLSHRAPLAIAGIVAAALGLSLFGCEEEKSEALIPEAETYRSWAQTIDTPLDYPIPGHENNFRKIYISPIGQELTIEEKNGRIFHSYPEGTLILKEIYAGLEREENEEPVQITAMFKASKAEKARGGWLWVVKNLSGKTGAEDSGDRSTGDSDEGGKGFDEGDKGADGSERIISGEFCITCHSNANENHPYGDGNPQEEFRDYVFFPPVQEASSTEVSPEE